MVSRRYLLASAWVAVASARAQENPAPRRLILDVSRALQAGNATRFMGYFDERQFKGFSDLRRSVSALLETRTAASSVDIISNTESSAGRTIKVDWILQLTPIADPGGIETRRQMVELVLTQQSSGAWRIASFDPVEFLRVL